RAWACLGECSQWGYWARLRSVEGCSAAPEVRVFHSPHRPSTRPLTTLPRLLCYKCFSGVPSARCVFWGGEPSSPFLFSASLFSQLPKIQRYLRLFRNQPKLRGLRPVEDCAAGAAHGDARLDLFAARRAFRLGFRVIQPRLIQAEFACRAPFQIRDEHGI